MNTTERIISNFIYYKGLLEEEGLSPYSSEELANTGYTTIANHYLLNPNVSIRFMYSPSQWMITVTFASGAVETLNIAVDESEVFQKLAIAAWCSMKLNDTKVEAAPRPDTVLDFH